MATERAAAAAAMTRKDLAGLLAEQKLFFGAAAAQDKLLPLIEAKDYVEGKQIYNEGDSVERHVCLILGGEVRLSRKGKHVADLGRGDFFGEFPLLDPSAKYNVTVTAREPTCIALVPWAELAAAADETPRVWRNMAGELAHRLRARPPLPALSSWKEVIPWLLTQLSFPRLVIGLLLLLAYGAYEAWDKLPEGSKVAALNKLGLEAACAPAVAASHAHPK